jgi:single-strand DNA-binding protein
MNQVILMGNLVRDPETKHTPGGNSVTETTIAVTKKWVTQSGEKKEKTAFIALVIWGKTGEAFAKFHAKGQRALIQGELIQETWEDKETGKKREKTKVQVDQWHFLPSGDRQQQQAPKAKIEPTDHPADSAAEDDVPF